MAHRRQKSPFSAFSASTSYSRRRASTAQSSDIGNDAESSAGFKTPRHSPMPLRGANVRTYFSRLSSVKRGTSDVTSPTLPPPKRKRVSLHPLSFNTTTNLSSHAGLGEQLGESEPEDDIQRREDADSLNEIIMAINMKERGTLGCAYYIAREEKLCMMEDIKMAGLDIIDLLKLHAQPTVLLISSRAEEDLEDYLLREARPIDRGDEDSKLCIAKYEALY